MLQVPLLKAKNKTKQTKKEWNMESRLLLSWVRMHAWLNSFVKMGVVIHPKPCLLGAYTVPDPGIQWETKQTWSLASWAFSSKDKIHSCRYHS